MLAVLSQGDRGMPDPKKPSTKNTKDNQKNNEKG
jgi:hypothetical protein